MEKCSAHQTYQVPVRQFHGRCLSRRNGHRPLHPCRNGTNHRVHVRGRQVPGIGRAEFLDLVEVPSLRSIQRAGVRRFLRQSHGYTGNRFRLGSACVGILNIEARESFRFHLRKNWAANLPVHLGTKFLGCSKQAALLDRAELAQPIRVDQLVGAGGALLGRLLIVVLIVFASTKAAADETARVTIGRSVSAHR